MNIGSVVFAKQVGLIVILVWVVVNLWDASLVALRLPTVLFGVASIPIIYLLGTKIFSEKEGLLAAFLLAISYHHTHYSQEARMYSMVFFFVLLCMYFLYTNHPSFALVALTFAVWTHYFAFLVLPIFIWWLVKKINLYWDEYVVEFLFAVIFLGMPLLILKNQLSLKTGGPSAFGIPVAPSFFYHVLGSFANINLQPFFLAILSVVVLYTLFVIGWQAEGRTDERTLLTSWMLFPVACSFFITMFIPFQPRYVLYCMAPFLLIVARGVTFLIKK